MKDQYSPISPRLFSSPSSGNGGSPSISGNGGSPIHHLPLVMEAPHPSPLVMEALRLHSVSLYCYKETGNGLWYVRVCVCCVCVCVRAHAHAHAHVVYEYIM